MLLGWFDRDSAIRLLTTERVLPITEAEAEAAWNTYRTRVEALPDRPRHEIELRPYWLDPSPVFVTDDPLTRSCERAAAAVPSDPAAAYDVRTVVNATAACIRPMRARGYGRIVTVGAAAALRARKNGGPYAMAKGALIRWTEALAEEVKTEGVTANVVLPSTIDHPANRASMPKADPKTWVSPEELANIIVFLCSDEASGITGAAIPVTART